MAEDLLIFKIVTPEGVIYEDDAVDKVTIPAADGEMTVLPGHSPLVSTMGTGELIIYKKGAEHPIACHGGILEIRPDSEVYVLADRAERAEHIDIERAQEARKRAEELLAQEKSLSDMDFARIQALIEKEMNRISVGKKYRKL